MTYLSLSRWSGQFTPEVIRRIRRKIAGNLAGGETVIVLHGHAAGLTDEVKRAIEIGWPPNKVRFGNAHPSAVPLSGKRPRRPRL
jgi:hypothetical protein